VLEEKIVRPGEAKFDELLARRTRSIYRLNFTRLMRARQVN
jgi:hypothetical protein